MVDLELVNLDAPTETRTFERGTFELYKVGMRYDNPEARKAHDYPIDPTQKEIKELFQGLRTA